MRVSQSILACLAVGALASTPGAVASDLPSAAAPQLIGPSGVPGAAAPEASGPSGGAAFGLPAPGVSTPSHPIVQGFAARIIQGVAYAPAYAPPAVKQAIWAGNQIRHKPYSYGGGHGSFKDGGYDCSGSVSYVLHAAGLIKTPMDSSDFMNWGSGGHGQWITVYTNPGHAFVQIAGIRLDTSAEADPHPARGSGPRWRPLFRRPSGFQARHPGGM